jgi:hypothetical protein
VRASTKWIIAGVVVAASVASIGHVVTHRLSRPLRAVPSHLATPPIEDLSNRTVSSEQISLRDKSREDAMQEWWTRRERDRNADWKVSIRFYGKVLDERQLPVTDAVVDFQWNDLSPSGTSKATALSDAQGNFSLEGVNGKRLSVRVKKRGYYTADRQNRLSFEFADPGEAIYYEPDPNRPVIFHLQKIGKGVPLIKKSIDAVVAPNGTVTKIELMSGKVSPVGQLEIQAWKPSPPRPLVPHYDWKVTLRLVGGGFVPAPEQFAFEAPETVYEQPIVFEQRADAGPVWHISAERTTYFAFGDPPKYGRIHFRTDAASSHVFLDYVINPSGSRILEEAVSADSEP